MKMTQHILAVLPQGERASTSEIALRLRVRGVWFVEARIWPALRALEDANQLERINGHPNTAFFRR